MFIAKLKLSRRWESGGKILMYSVFFSHAEMGFLGNKDLRHGSLKSPQN